MISTAVISLVFGMIGGIASWFAVDWFVEPYRQFKNIRSRSPAAIIQYGNISSKDDERCGIAQTEIRQIASELEGLLAVMPKFFGLVLKQQKYDTDRAVRGLIGMSNTIIKQDGSVVLQRHMVERALKLTLTDTKEVVEAVDRRLAGL